MGFLMENLKVKVNSESESKEAQELFSKLGYMVVNNIDCEKGYVVASKSAESPINFYYWHCVTSIIPLPQLRDMVNQDQDDPFLTPECTLNDQYAEIERVRQVIKVKSGSDPDHALDAMSFGLMGAGAAQASGGVDATLAERQSTYGCFEDVAFVTENIMSVLSQVRVNGLRDLPSTHRMALYMIASKLARIVNGDFNHFDSWHDIGGYAKLIENLIGDKDASSKD